MAGNMKLNGLLTIICNVVDFFAWNLWEVWFTLLLLYCINELALFQSTDKSKIDQSTMTTSRASGLFVTIGNQSSLGVNRENATSVIFASFGNDTHTFKGDLTWYISCKIVFIFSFVNSRNSIPVNRDQVAQVFLHTWVILNICFSWTKDAAQPTYLMKTTDQKLLQVWSTINCTN